MVWLRNLILTTTVLSSVSAQVTVYPTPGLSALANATHCIGAVPCDGNVLKPDPVSSDVAPNVGSVPIQLQSGGMNGLSLPLGNFFGFSLELSVVDKLMGTNGNAIDPVFLNLLSLVVSRSKYVMLRVGGNTQELAVLKPDGLPKGAMIHKGSSNTDATGTPMLILSPSLIYTMSNISRFLPTVQWFIGVPFNDTGNPRLELANLAQTVLGDKLIGMQLGNEPDLYHQNGIRDTDYTPAQYAVEWGQVLNDYLDDPRIANNTNFVAPSVCCGGNIGWTPEQVWNTGFLTSYANHLGYLAVQHYPSDNCNVSNYHIDPQTLLKSVYLNHNAIQGSNAAYVNSTSLAQSIGKPFMIFETNSASCGGFSGLSDSFASTLWAVDYSLNMAIGNVSHALFHVGGQSNYYNPFTPPPANQSRFRKWTVGPVFYSSLVVAETLGSSGQARVADLNVDNNSPTTPGYAVYENGVPQRVVLMNFVTDPTGASNYTAYISVGGNSTGTPATTPASVRVKYLLADSVTQKFNITWAGQTLGGPFESDGRFQGTEQIYTYACDQANNVCAVPVPAPSLALVFFSSDALQESGPSATVTFATTTTHSGAPNTATVNQAVLATSNGRGGGNWEFLGSTSFRRSTSGEGRGIHSNSAASIVAAFILGASLLL